MTGQIEERLSSLGIVLPPALPMRSCLTPCRRVGDLLFLSGHGPKLADGSLSHVGRIGAELSVEQGYEAARVTGLRLLRTITDSLGSLDPVEGVVKALGFVNSAPGFFDQPEVMHGFSDLMVEVFGDRGVHSRSAIGTSILPNNQPVEIELIVAVRN